ncbi:THUMP-like domain-containing protein [Leucobacter sp. M11]|uniref:THUMP-like domain-containing protein n=1 Tax=Leucobacter sp. M11 TaxID=2993565 RepID=UPI002D7E9256|nr:SAM-dependent methyltransferase [Leucobacter sp. M11]MEB4614276.1 SAM-dependent methyltransferase [Leucobacter sp. M11]
MTQHTPGTPGPDAGWEFLFSAPGRERLAELDRSTPPGADTAGLVPELRRAGHTPEETSALLTQLRLRRQARAKLGDLFPTDGLLTQAGLEQASRAVVAREHAARYRAAGITSVADLGCGIGTESLALAEAGLAVRAVELDPVTARIAAHNLAGFPRAEVRTGDAASAELAGVEAVFLDPARRTAGHSDTARLTSVDDYSPSLAFAFGLARERPAGVKLGPGFDRELIPDAAEAQWVSVGGQVVEMGLWFGSLARPGVTRSALVLAGGDGRAGAQELSARADSEDEPVRPSGSVLYEPDGAVIRARLIGDLARSLGAGMLSDRIAYLTADEFVPTPFATGYRILDEVPVKERDLRRELAARGIGTLEIKKRGIDVDPAQLRTRLKLKGRASATLFLTRVAGQHTAFLAERC